MPDSNSALYAHLFAFVDAAPDNGSIVNYDQFIDLVEGVFLLRANPARWFYASAMRCRALAKYHLQLTFRMA